MKKTLIALMALAGVAMAAETTKAVQTIYAEFSTAPTFGGNCWSNDYVLTFSLTEEYTITESGSIIAAYWQNGQNTNSTDGGGYNINAIYLTEANGCLTLNVGDGIVDKNIKDTSTTESDKITNDLTFTNQRGTTFADVEIEKGITYTLSVSGGDSKMIPSLSWVDADGVAFSETATLYNGNMNGGGAHTVGGALPYGVNKGIVYISESTPSIPEPATATLSLLALAGLAARRRRH